MFFQEWFAYLLVDSCVTQSSMWRICLCFQGAEIPT